MENYRIREIDGEENADILAELHLLTFFDSAPLPDFSNGYWWLATLGKESVAFIGIIQSILGLDTGYFTRVGVLPSHRGHQLQAKLMRAMEAKARRLGWQHIVTDTTDNVPSSNNIIAAGYRLFEPKHRWSFGHSLYWHKQL